MKAITVPKLTREQQRILDEQLRRQSVKINEQYLDDVELMIMYVLRKETGYGKERLKRIYMDFVKNFDAIVERYVFDGPEDVMWFVDRELKGIGVDVRQWREETKKESGNNEQI